MEYYVSLVANLPKLSICRLLEEKLDCSYIPVVA
jgi:hypothetical protein